MMAMVITRSAAMRLGLVRYFTGKSCGNGHIAERRTHDWRCVVCYRLRTRNRRASGGSQAANHARKVRDSQRPGKSQHHSRVACRRRSSRKWGKSDSPAAHNHRVARSLRVRLSKAIANGQRSGSAVRDLGCSVAFLRDYLAARFQPGMTWDNYGEWHIDHRRPLSSFDLSDRPQFLEAVHYTNLQPLWAVDNLAKGARVG